MSFEEKWISENPCIPLTGVYPEGRYPQTNTWLMVTVSEYSTLCLDYGLVAALVSINTEVRERRGMVQRDKLCGCYDRLREKEKGIVLWWLTRRFDAYTPYRGQRFSFPRSLVCISYSSYYVVCHFNTARWTSSSFM